MAIASGPHGWWRLCLSDRHRGSPGRSRAADPIGIERLRTSGARRTPCPTTDQSRRRRRPALRPGAEAEVGVRMMAAVASPSSSTMPWSVPRCRPASRAATDQWQATHRGRLHHSWRRAAGRARCGSSWRSSFVAVPSSLRPMSPVGSSKRSPSACRDGHRGRGTRPLPDQWSRLDHDAASGQAPARRRSTRARYRRPSGAHAGRGRCRGSTRSTVEARRERVAS